MGKVSTERSLGATLIPKGKTVQTEDSPSTKALRHTCLNSKGRDWEERGGKTEAMSQKGSQWPDPARSQEPR